MDLIVIPSSGRHLRQQTLWAFHKTKIIESYPVAIAVYEDEVAQYKRVTSYKGRRIRGAEIISVPEAYRGIARKREWIITKLAPKRNVRNLLVVDDDLWFCRRPNISEPYMPYIHEDVFHMHRMVEMLTSWLEMGIVHAGLISRQANRVLDTRWQQPGRQMNVHAFNVEAINKIPLKWGRVPVMEDFDITLQLLNMGYVNRISCRYAWTTTSNMDGGCSSYRTADLQTAAAHKLAKLHPGIVTVVEKTAKTWKNQLGQRTDVRVSWQKAYQGSKRKRGYVPAKLRDRVGSEQHRRASA
jgi:hypothetical protein